MFCKPYCQAKEIKNNKLLSLACDILPDFLSFFAENVHFLKKSQ